MPLDASQNKRSEEIVQPMAEAEKMDAARDQKMDTTKTFSYPDLNVQSYVKAYDHRGRLNRLFLIMHHIPEHQTTAALDAISEVQHCMMDEELFQRVYRRARNILGDNHDACSYEEGRLEQTRKATREESNRLDEDVQRWRNLNKDENARIAYVELADHFEKQGKFETALAKYLEAYDFADTHYQQIELRIRICKAAILGNSWAQIKSYAPHILESMEFKYQINKQKDSQGALMICLGLYYLHKRMYAEAAHQFVMNPCQGLGPAFKNIISEEHIGLYGALCAVVAYTRGAFEDRVIRNKVFQSYLQQSKKANALVKAYHECRYADVTTALRDLDVDARIDIYLKDQASDILSAVRGKAMVQFFSPFSAMGMSRMAEAFGVTVEELESELVTCISQGHINAKIDSHNKVVQAVDPDEEGDLFTQITGSGKKWTRETKAALLRMSLIQNHVDLHQNRGDGGHFEDSGEEHMFGGIGTFLGLGGRRNRGVF